MPHLKARCATLVASFLCLAISTTVFAAGLAPKKPSALRTLLGNAVASPVCGPGGLGFVVDQQQNSDGTTEPFVLPEGNVLIVTSWDWEIGNTALDAGKDLGVVLYIWSGGTDFSILSRAAANASTLGYSSGREEVPVGAAVKSPGTLCFSGSITGTTYVVVHGFLAKDN